MTDRRTFVCADGLVVGADGFIQAEQRSVVDFAASNRLVATYPSREFVDAGGLTSYAVNYPDLYRRLATVVDKVLKGERPADIPVERPTKFELVINVKTAAALGLTIPKSLALRADQLVQ